MKLSDLRSGEEAYIIDVTGNGAIKKRINEMGFIRGRKVKAIKSAPLKDPVEYDIMGYKLTIRQKDAAMVAVEQRRATINSFQEKKGEWIRNKAGELVEQEKKSKKDTKTIHVALVGNPNCGKTTIFNFATNSRERVANYSGVTVAAKEARFEINGYIINVIDLPGTYSLSSVSPEEMFVTDYLLHKKPDLVVNVLDAGNIERNLYLTTQLIDMGITTVAALNMYDELAPDTIQLDYKKLGTLLGIPVVPTIGKKGKGIKELFDMVIRVFTESEDTIRSINIPYIKEIEEAITYISDRLTGWGIYASANNRLIAIQLLEGDPNVYSIIHPQLRNTVGDICREKRTEIESLLAHDINTEIIHSRYGFIEGALSETLEKGHLETVSLSQRIDRILTHKYWGLPVFFAIIWLMFFSTFKLGETPMGWIEYLIGVMSDGLRNVLPAGIASSFVIDGVIGGVGGVAVFLPNIIILFFLISLMEDSGYMARTAFLMDKVMHRAGLHGKSFIPLLMGFGCNVPAIMATRTIESKRDRLITMFITPFMSCSARLPVYVLFISAFFPHYESFVLFAIYSIGIFAALITAIILNKTVFRKIESPFVMELPPYRMPTLKAISKHTWFKTNHFIRKMGTVILIASVIIWYLGYFPRDAEITAKYDLLIEKQKALSANIGNENIYSSTLIHENIENLKAEKHRELLSQSYISRIGQAMQPVFDPLGFDWKMSVSVLTGIMAKEVVVSSMGILYHTAPGNDENNHSLVDKLRAARDQDQTSLLTYFGFLVFILLYFPCMGTLIAIKKETARMKWTLFSAIYPLVFAWITTFLIHQAASFFS